MLRILIISLLLPLTTFSQGYFSWSPAVEKAYDEVLDLKLERARSSLQFAQLKEPDNLCIPLVESYIDFLYAFITEEDDKRDQFKKGKDRRLKAIRQGELEDPFYLFSQAQIHLQSALVRLKFKEYLGAFNDVSQAYDQLDYNARKFPDFLPNQVSLGLLRALVGTIPDGYQWGARLLGLEGDLHEGMEQMLKVLNTADPDDFILRTEAEVMCALSLFHLAKKPEEAWTLVQQMNWDEEESLLATFVKANMAGKMGLNDEVIRLLENRPIGSEYPGFWFLEYMLGEAKLRALQPEARHHLHHFLENYRGQNYIKDAHRKLGWYQIIFNNGEDLKSFKRACLDLGQTQIDADKSAEKWAQSSTKEHSILLQARLLFDGGYFDLAEALLTDLDPAALNEEQLLEYYYRKGRCHHGKEEWNSAKKLYSLVLQMSEQSQDYRIANSALQMGLIEERLGNKDEAFLYFKMCKEMKSDEYQASLNQKAKAGMERVGAR